MTESVIVVEAVKYFAAFIRANAVTDMFVGQPPKVGDEVILVCTECTENGIGLNYKVKNNNETTP